MPKISDLLPFTHLNYRLLILILRICITYLFLLDLIQTLNLKRMEKIKRLSTHDMNDKVEEFVNSSRVSSQRTSQLIKLWKRLQAGSSSRKCHGKHSHN